VKLKPGKWSTQTVVENDLRCLFASKLLAILNSGILYIWEWKKPEKAMVLSYGAIVAKLVIKVVYLKCLSLLVHHFLQSQDRSAMDFNLTNDEWSMILNMIKFLNNNSISNEKGSYWRW